MEELSLAVGHEVFVTAFGALRFRKWVDPLTASISHTFHANPGSSNLASFTKSSNDSELFNHIAVYGSAQHNGLVYAQASNTNPASPTRIARLGRRTRPVPSQFVANNVAAQALANSLLSVAALEQYDVAISALKAPWLEVGTAVEFLDPDAAETDPTRFLLTNYTIPMELGLMTGTAKRVVNVG
jgi:hypothetical protein